MLLFAGSAAAAAAAQPRSGTINFLMHIYSVKLYCELNMKFLSHNGDRIVGIIHNTTISLSGTCALINVLISLLCIATIEVIISKY